MFRKMYNQAIVKGSLVPDGPVLVVDGREPTDPTAPSLAFVRTRRKGGDTVYLPGSSLKGVLRSHAERLLATELGPEAAENPFDFTSAARSLAHVARDNGDTPEVYRLSCAADRLYGSTEVAGRFRVADALPPEGLEVQTETRFGVAIDRAKQAVLHGPFDQEAVTSGSFELTATLENFELWMMSLVLQTLRDLAMGLVRVGHATSRGFGALKLEVPKLELRWLGGRPQAIEGAGAREADAELRARYGLLAGDSIPFPAGVTHTRDGFFAVATLAGWPALAALGNTLQEFRWEPFKAAELARVAEVKEEVKRHAV